MATTRSQRRRGRLLGVNNRLLIRHERLLQRDVRAVFARASKELVSRANRAINPALTTSGVRRDMIKGLETVFRVRLKQIITLFGRSVLSSLQERGFVGKSSAHVHLETKDFDSEFDLAVREFIDLYAFDKAEEVTDAFLDRARITLQRSFEEGMGEVDLVEALRVEFENISETAAQRIARTESHTAANYGSDIAARATGLELVKEWGATDDPRTRPTHTEADGQRVLMDDTFRVGDANLAYPGDPTGPPGEVINCRCTVLYYPIVNGEVID